MALQPDCGFEYLSTLWKTYKYVDINFNRLSFQVNILDNNFKLISNINPKMDQSVLQAF